MDGFGPVKPGMTPAQVKKVIGVRVLEDTDSPTEECWYIRALDELDGVSLMIIDGRVARIEIDSPEFRTLSGAGLDTSEEELKKLYGSRLMFEPHKYAEDEGNYVTLRSQDGRFGVRFETFHGKVGRFYAGPWEHLRYVEGCA
jgi:hypothetical protein